MTPEQILKAAEDYEEQVRLEELYRKNLQNEVDKLNKSINNSYNAPIYKKIFQLDYGDYNMFVEAVASKLRERSRAANSK
jgi:glutathionyl-hydroquinone reductase